MVEQRRTYVVDTSGEERDADIWACEAVLDLLRAETRRALVDAYSDHRDDLPMHVDEVECWLRQLGAGRAGRRRDSYMAIAVDPAIDAEWAAMRSYAPWSISVDLHGESDELLAVLSDDGSSIVAELTNEQAAQLKELLADVAPVVPLEVARAKLQAAEAAAQAARRARWRARVRVRGLFGRR